MLVLVGDWVFNQVLHFVQGWEDVIEPLPRGGEGVAAAEGCFKQFTRPEALVMGFPEFFPSVGL